MKKLLSVLLTMTALGAALGLSGTSSATQFPGVNGQITYSVLNQQNRTLFSVNPDGTNSTTVIPSSGGWTRAVF